ncbi:MAG: histidinol-phosphatase [Clostridia bacterium]|nr:histidinol-phosphatase [Clostridia bacterium]
MLTNYHTHTTFCDGQNSPEEVVLYAIDNGFDAIGFSGHGYTPFSLEYCMKDTKGYIDEISRLKEKYADKIQIYCGIEEDAFAPVDRSDFDYIIGSSHYFCIDCKYYEVDISYDYFKECLNLFDNNPLKLAENYYKSFCNYIAKRKPDIVGHFDLITKFDEVDEQIFLNNSKYLKIAQKYMYEAAKSNVIFEVNTGAIARGYRKSPYPNEDLLYILKKQDAKIMLSSDSHNIKTLDFQFSEVKKMLRDIGFECVYVLYDNTFKKCYI